MILIRSVGLEIPSEVMLRGQSVELEIPREVMLRGQKDSLQITPAIRGKEGPGLGRRKDEMRTFVGCRFHATFHSRSLIVSFNLSFQRDFQGKLGVSEISLIEVC